MKYIIIASLIISTHIFAQTRLGPEAQLSQVEKIAKAERRELWRSGHQEVTSEVLKVTRAGLDEVIRENSEVEEPLDQAQTATLYRCTAAKNSCSLFLINLSAEMMGGYGHSRIWVLLNPVTGKAEKIEQLVYAE